jgi:hypothetical protein
MKQRAEAESPTPGDPLNLIRLVPSKGETTYLSVVRRQLPVVSFLQMKCQFSNSNNKAEITDNGQWAKNYEHKK